ncbi:MAG TPA: PQQ-binding-like beta-propeller repeat protein [Vicinamibacteria bacterium]|nr:PQQ-binding-like beta-propeller repeat protein [Vicinamibacteria bacterium]
MKCTRLFLPAVLCATTASSQSPSPAWPQWGGPTRDFKAPAVRLAASWPASGPRALWSRDLGDGYSAIVTDGDALYTMYRPPKGMLATMASKFTGSDPEAVIALDAATGRTRWEHVYEAAPQKGMDMAYGPGPHATPLIAGDLVFAVGTNGHLVALEKATGKQRWAQELWSGLGGTVQGRGYSCSPLAYGGNVIVTVGGNGQAVVAFRQRDGQIAWKAGDLEPSPSSLMVISLDGQDQLLMFHANGIAGLDPTNGALLWDHPHKTDWGLNIALPIWSADDKLLFVSSAYSGGSRVLQLARAGGETQVKELWFSSKMRIHHGNGLRIGDYVYGSSGDFGPSFLIAMNVRTGELAWQERGLAKATAVLADGKLVLLDEEGTLALASATPQRLTILSKASVFQGRSWTAPTLAGTRLFLRDRAAIKAFDIG